MLEHGVTAGGAAEERQAQTGMRGSGWYWGANIVAIVAGVSTEPYWLTPPLRSAAR
jgi:hypothetical protein